MLETTQCPSADLWFVNQKTEWTTLPALRNVPVHDHLGIPRPEAIMHRNPSGLVNVTSSTVN